jgi:nucleotidyltransferase substrate binding protein (TIGR01987 family)
MIKPEYKKSVDLLKAALARLNEILLRDAMKDKDLIDGTIQRFEFSIELFWKALKKKLLYDHGIDAQSPKSVLQQSYINQLISDEKVWLDMLEDRNLTSHTYNQELALEIYQHIQKYGPFLEQECKKIFKD